MLVDYIGLGVRLSDVVTLKSALAERANQTGGSLTYAKGTDILGSSEDGFAEAIQAAEHADVVVLALGESDAMSGEAGSRADLDLPGNQQKLLETIAATGRPIVLLVFSGRPLVLTWASEHIPAIMEVWFPGTEAGSAIANVLYGDVVPTGKLPMSFPRSVGQEPLYYNHFATGRPAAGIDQTPPTTPQARFVSRYLDVPNDPLFPFGFGLSYSKFSYSDVHVSRADIPLREAQNSKASKLISATAIVRNDGERAATEIVQCYVRNLGASLEQPVRSLRGFARVSLNPAESKKISFDLGFPELSFVNSEAQQVMEPTHYTIWIGGSSLATEHADFGVTPEHKPRAAR
jgi:beta-glucosidase